jgi:hypothetical protein
MNKSTPKQWFEAKIRYLSDDSEVLWTKWKCPVDPKGSGYGLNWARGCQPRWRRFDWPLYVTVYKLKLKMIYDEHSKQFRCSAWHFDCVTIWGALNSLIRLRYKGFCAEYLVGPKKQGGTPSIRIQGVFDPNKSNFDWP